MLSRTLIVRLVPATWSFRAVWSIAAVIALASTTPAAPQQSAPADTQPAGTSPSSAPAATRPASTQPIERASDVQPALSEDWAKLVAWRSIGPANMGGRITALAISQQDPSMWYVATASGGLLKSTNAGMSFEHLFDREATVSIGDVAVAPSNDQIVWIGTGEANPRNSSSWGDGVYKSLDGGKTWKNMGLKDSFQTGQIAIHPTDPNVVFIGALGHLWGPNNERGLYKTTDAGETWERVLFVDDMTGVIDVKMQPGNPDVMLCAAYERQRDGYDGNDPAKKFGPGSAIHRSTDGGKTWTKIAAGLPTAKLGRIGLEWYAKDPNIVYAIIESEKIAQEPENAAYAGFVGEDADVGCRITRIEDDSPAAKAGLKVGDIIVRFDDVTIQSSEDATRQVRRHLAGETVKVEVSREKKAVAMDMTFDKRPGAEEDQATTQPSSTQPASTQPATQPSTRPAARTEEREAGGGGEGEGQSEQDRERAERQREAARTPFSSGLGGQRENIQDQQGPDGHEFGGLYMSSDAGLTWKRINSVNPRPMYYSEIRVDPNDNKFIFVLGTSLYLSEDGGETFKAGMEGEAHVDHHAMWIDPRDGRHVLLGNDGGLYESHDRAAKWDHHNHMAIGQFYHVSLDPRRTGNVYGGLQDNGTWGGPMRVRDNAGPINEDWFNVGGGDGFISWVDPVDPDVVFSTSQNGAVGWRNFRTGEGGGVRPRGERNIRLRWNWETPYVLSAHNSRIVYTAGNHVFKSVDRGGAMQRISDVITTTEQGTASAISESPRDANVLYVGTDDGNLWVTRDGGREWTNLFADAQAASQPGTSSEPAAASQPDQPARSGAGTGERAARGGGGGGGRQTDPARMLEQLKQADANGDGLIQRDEMPRRMAATFGRFDLNDDGALDQDELAAMTQRAGGGAATTTAPAAATAPATAPATETAAQPAAPAEDDLITGSWEGRMLGEDMPADRAGFTFTLQLAADGKVSGRITTQFNEGDATGRFNRETKRLDMTMQTDQFEVVYSATLSAAGMNGHAKVGDGMFEFDFEAKRMSGVSTGDAGAAPVPAVAANRPQGPRRGGAGGGGPRGQGGAGGGGGGGGGGQSRQGAAGKPLREMLPGPRWVSSLEASRFAPGRVYVTFDGHRSDDLEPYVMVSDDYGESWRSIRANLPTMAGSTKCVREDLFNQDVLWLGCEFSAWVSIDRGASWTKLSALPTVAVHDFAQHPTSGEIVAGTHGRSLWAADVTPLRQLTAEALGQRAALLKPNEAIQWRREPERAGTLRRFVGQNPPAGASVYYVVSRPAQRVKLQILDPITGEVLKEADGAREPGMYKVDWDLRRPPPPAPAGGAAGARGGQGGRGGAGGGGFRRGGALVPPGAYKVVLIVDDVTLTAPLVVSVDPDHPDVRPAQAEEVEELLREMNEEDEGGGEEDEETVN